MYVCTLFVHVIFFIDLLFFPIMPEPMTADMSKSTWSNETFVLVWFACFCFALVCFCFFVLCLCLFCFCFSFFVFIWFTLISFYFNFILNFIFFSFFFLSFFLSLFLSFFFFCHSSMVKHIALLLNSYFLYSLNRNRINIFYLHK